ncbi:MAG: hypothetical protein V4451_05835 [Pseudomonadota bacterium]
MTTATLTNTCNVCGAEESLDGLLHRMIDDDTVRHLIADVLTASLPLGALVVRYLRLHKPEKQRLRMSVVAKLLGELVPDIQRNVIERTGRRWAVNGDSWKAALEAVFESQAKGTLTLPLQGNGYLYQVLMRMADKDEAAQERTVDATRKGRAHQAGTATVSDVLERAQALATDMNATNAAHAIPPAPPRARTGDTPLVRQMKAELASKKGTPI